VIRLLIFLFSICYAGPTLAWSVSAHAGQAGVDRLVRAGGDWWSEVDDRNMAVGIALGYEHHRWLGFRLMYERANDFRTINRCPTGAVCPAVALREHADLSNWSFAALPRLQFTRDWALYGIAGAMHWRLRVDGILPGDSGTAFTYGGGIAWRTSPRIDLSMEYQRAKLDYDAWRIGVTGRF
jgi:opacity protein-like surface antigen